MHHFKTDDKNTQSEYFSCSVCLGFEIIISFGYTISYIKFKKKEKLIAKIDSCAYENGFYVSMLQANIRKQ